MSTDFKREAAWHYLCSLKNIGIRSIEKLIILSGSPEEALKVDTETIKEAGIFSAAALNEWNDTAVRRRDNYAYYESSHKGRYRFISKDHPDYPDKLKIIDLAPYGLWVIGKLPAKEKRCAAIIGSRVSTEYGRSMAEMIGAKLAGWNIGVVSGMAMGIDAEGQWGALKNGGYSLGVLGCGVDICYPACNIELYEYLANYGGIISEFAPGSPGLAQNFRQRNRLISGLSECVIVTEARKKSGTQLTVSWALDQGKEVFALPGRFTDKYSEGCNQMISDGACILNDMDTLRDFFGAGSEKENAVITLTEDEKRIYSLLTGDMQHFEHLYFKAGMKTDELFKVLYSLEKKGLATQPMRNHFTRRLF